MEILGPTGYMRYHKICSHSKTFKTSPFPLKLNELKKVKQIINLVISLFMTTLEHLEIYEYQNKDPSLILHVKTRYNFNLLFEQLILETKF